MSFKDRGESGYEGALARIKKIFSLGLIGNALTIASNFLIPPLFISSLGEERYGTWLYLFSIPMSLAMLDFGISAAISTDVYKKHAEGFLADASATFKTGIKTISLIVSLVFILLSALVAAHYAKNGSAEDHLVVIILGAYILIGFQGEICSAAYKVSAQFQRFQLATVSFRAAEIVATVLLIARNNFVEMATALLVIRTLSSAGIAYQGYRLAPYLFTGDWYKKSPLKALWLPSAMYAVNPLIMFVSLQVPLLVLTPIVGFSGVVVYTTIRTLARLPLQISSQVSFSLFTEYTRMAGNGDSQVVMRFYTKGALAIGSIFGVYLVIGTVLGPAFYNFWIGNAPADFRIIFGILLGEALLESAMRHRISLSSAFNRHVKDTLLHLGLAISSSLALFLGAKIGGGMLTGLCFSALVSTAGLVLALRLRVD